MSDDEGMAPQEPEVAIHHFADDGNIPNNPTLPLLAYKDVLDLAGVDAAATCIERFAAHGWHGAWRNGIFPFPHYHSTAHEVLGICQGEAKVSLGGEHGLVMTVKSGDALAAASRHRTSKSGLKPRSSRRRRLSGRHGLGSLSWQTACARGGTPQHPSRTASG